MRIIQQIRQSAARYVLGAVALVGVGALSGCMYGHERHDREGDYGRPAEYREHDERWHSDRDIDRDRHQDRDRHERRD